MPQRGRPIGHMRWWMRKGRESVVSRRRWLVLLASLVLLGVSGYFLARGGDFENPDSVASSESGRASALLNTERPPAPAPPQSPAAAGHGDAGRCVAAARDELRLRVRARHAPRHRSSLQAGGP